MVVGDESDDIDLMTINKWCKFHSISVKSRVDQVFNLLEFKNTSSVYEYIKKKILSVRKDYMV